MPENGWNRFSRRIDVSETEHEEGARAGAFNEAELRAKRNPAGAFRSHERARDMKSIFRQKLIQVISGHSPRNLREFGANTIGIPVSDGFQLPVHDTLGP